MKKIITSILVILLPLILISCTSKNEQIINASKQTREVFLPLISKNFSEELTLEEGYEIIRPYVEKWANDATLSIYQTNITTSQNNFKVNFYAFDSLLEKKTINIGYNLKVGKNLMPSDPKEYVRNNSFSIMEKDWTKEPDWKDLSESELIEAEKHYIPFNNLDNLLTSQEIIGLAKKEGLDDFINQYKNFQIKNNQVQFMNTSKENGEWFVSYAVGEPNIERYSRFVGINFDSKTGEITNKVIK